MKYVLWLFILLMSWQVEAQSALSDSTDSADDSLALVQQKSNMLELTANFTDKVVFRGRDFGLKQAGYNQEIRYRNPQQWYLGLSTYFWSGVGSNPAKTDLSIGYEWAWSKTLSMDVSLERWFFSNDSFLDPEALKNMAAINLSYSPKNWEIEVDAFYMWGEDKALLLSADIGYHWDVFQFNKKCALEAIPNILVEGFAGDNLAYYRFSRKTNREKPVFVRENFSLANIELSLPVTLHFMNWEITAEGHFAKPFPIQEESPPLSAYLQNGFFYFTLAAKYALYWN